MKTAVDRIRRWQRRLLDAIVSSNPRLGLDQRAEHLTSIFETDLAPDSFVLDLGGGWGFYDAPLRARGHQPVIMDVVKPGLQKAPVFLYDGTRIPFKDDTFDAVLLITMLHHTPEPENILREARRVTRDKLIVIEDVYHHPAGRWWTILRDRLYNFEYFGHPCSFKKSAEWEQLIENVGFSPIRRKEIYTWLAGMRILNGVFVFQKKGAV